MIAALAAPSAPLFTPQRGAPRCQLKGWLPSTLGASFHFGASLPRILAVAGWRTDAGGRSLTIGGAAGRGGLDSLRRSDSMAGPRGFAVRLGQLFSRAACLSRRRPGRGQPMRISLCNEVVRELSFERQCAFARAVGYDGLEIAPFTLGEDPHLLPPSRRTGLRAAAAAEGIVITSLHYLMLVPKGLSITSEASAEHQRSIDVMSRLCDLAADLGAGVLVHGSPAQRQLEVGREAEGRKRAVAAFAAAAEAAGNAGVTYCIEPLAATETNTDADADTLAAALQEILK